MLSDGLIPLLIPLGVTIFIFKLRIRFKKIILFGFALLPFYYVVSLMRKDILSLIIYFFIALVINVFLSKQYKILLSKIVNGLLVLIFLIVGAYFIFPKYAEAARISLVESYNVIKYGKTSTGETDERLGFHRTFIVDQIKKYPLFGTGFDNRWRTSKGDKQGFEAADYPLLAAFARYGVVGIIIFVPVYFFLIKILKKDLVLLQNESYDNTSLLILLLMTFITFFIFHLLQYFNWFASIASDDFYYWYCYLALYLAARYRYYFLQNQRKLPHLNLNPSFPIQDAIWINEVKID